jgi:hypothetical protein
VLLLIPPEDSPILHLPADKTHHPQKKGPIAGLHNLAGCAFQLRLLPDPPEGISNRWRFLASENRSQ